MRVNSNSLLYISVFCGLTTIAQASDEYVIECKSPGGDIFNINVGVSKYEDVPLICLDAEFITDMTPCSPADGWGLSAGAGTASLVRITKQPNVAGSHSGGITAAYVSALEIGALGQFGNGETTRDLWNVKIDRKTGKGEVEIFDEGVGEVGKTSDYICEKIERKF